MELRLDAQRKIKDAHNSTYSPAKKAKKAK